MSLDPLPPDENPALPHHVRRRRAKFLLRLLPRRALLHKYPVVGRFAAFARQRHYLWSFRTEHVRRAFYAGSVLSLLPVMGVQLPLAFALSLLLRSNFMVLGGLQFITNPITAAPIYYATHQLGAGIIAATGFGRSLEVAREPLPAPDLDLDAAETASEAAPAPAAPPPPHRLPWTKRIGTAINALVIGGVVSGLALGALLDLAWRFFAAHPLHLPHRSRPPASRSTEQSRPPE